MIETERMAKVLQEIAKLSEMRVNDDSSNSVFVLTDPPRNSHVTSEIKIGLDHAAQIAKEALRAVSGVSLYIRSADLDTVVVADGRTGYAVAEFHYQRGKDRNPKFDAIRNAMSFIESKRTEQST